MKTEIIEIPKKEILKNMFRDNWVTIEALIENRITIELILMYKHGIIPLNEIGSNYDEYKLEKITIGGQIKAHELAVDKCKFSGIWRDDFYKGLGIMHQHQLKLLKNLNVLFTTQYN